MQLVKHLPLIAFWTVMILSYEARAISNHEAVKTSAAIGSPVAPLETAKVKSYREWKSEKVQEALTRVTATKTQIEMAKSKDPNLAHHKGGLEAKSGVDMELLESQLEEDQSSLDMAKDLSVTDYFVGYLTKLQDKKAAFNEVAGKLTAEEVAELMSAYANSVFGSHNGEMAPSASNLSSDRVR